MPCSRRTLLLLMSLMLLLPGNGWSASGTGTFFDPPDTSAPADPVEIVMSISPPVLYPGIAATLSITLDIAPGHRVYAHATDVTLAPLSAIEAGALRRPPSVEKADPSGAVFSVYEGEAVFEIPLEIDPDARPGLSTLDIDVRYQACTETRCLFPQSRRMPLEIEILPETLLTNPDQAAPRLSERPEPPRMERDAAPGAASEKENPYAAAARRFGVAGLLAAAFLWGIFTSLTPCVYPMIPITVGVIGASSAGNALRGFTLSLIYVLGMSLTYAAFGVAAAWSGGLFGAYSDHPAVRIGIAAILIVLALGMFDLIHLQVPPRISTRLSRIGAGGKVGVLLTGMAAGAVVGPCVGPMLVGLLIYIASLGSKVMGFLIMWSFSLGMGVLFLVIGTFSGAITTLPRAGIWMVQIKHFFGVMMLAMALYFLGRIVPAPVFHLSVGAFLIGLGVYTGALDPITPETTGANRFRKAAGILLLTFGIAMTAKVAAGPALFSGMEETAEVAGAPLSGWKTDESLALKTARAENKPVLIDFYADWCAACRRLDATTFRSADFRQASRAFVMLRVDNSDHADPAAEALRQKYGVVGLPTIVFLTPAGQTLANETVTDYINARDLVARMARVRRRATAANPNPTSTEMTTREGANI